MLSLYANTFHGYLIGAVLIQFLTSFSRLDAIEMPLELFHDSLHVAKPVEYVRRIAQPHDVDNEMPPIVVEDDMEIATNDGGASAENEDLEGESNAKADRTQWLQHQVHQHQPEHINYQSPTQHKHIKHHHSNRQVHTSTSSPAVSPLRRCSIEISSKIPGICQSMGSIGNACVSGDYIDVFNVECL